MDRQYNVKFECFSCGHKFIKFFMIGEDTTEYKDQSKVEVTSQTNDSRTWDIHCEWCNKNKVGIIERSPCNDQANDPVKDLLTSVVGRLSDIRHDVQWSSSLPSQIKEVFELICGVHDQVSRVRNTYVKTGQ